MDIVPILIFTAAAIVLPALGYLSGREKEKRDVLQLIQQTGGPGTATLVYMIDMHKHRVYGRRSHYDERKRQHT